MTPWTTPPRPDAPSPRASRRRAGLGVLALVLLLHWCTAAGLGAPDPAGRGAPPAAAAPAPSPRSVVVGVVVVAPPAAVTGAPAAGPPARLAANALNAAVAADGPPPARAAARARSAAVAVAVAAPAPAPAPPPAAAPAAVPAPTGPVVQAAVPAPAPAPDAASHPPDSEPDEGQAGAPGAGETRPPPLYATRLPPPAELHFTLQRGALGGHAALRWQPQGTHYELHFDAHLALGLPLMRQRSQGAIDAHGLAPERFTDRRGRRGAQAAHFQRAEGRITFSGPAVDYPAWPGAQDRLSWIVQLAGILAAAAEPPPEVSLFVVSARGGAGTWTFVSEGREPLDTPDGAVTALRLRREPERAEDLRVDIWLDPAHHHWPLRIRMAPVRGGEPLDLRLDSRRAARSAPVAPGP